MDKDSDFDIMIKEMERELLDLKTTHNVGASVTPYYYQYEPTSLDSLTITYGSGRQDIVTQVFIDGDAVLGSVVNNVQNLFISAQTATTVWIVSTRPIINVEQNMV